MKLDATDLRYLSDDVFRTLTAAEMGSKNHEVVPSALIAQISGLRSGGVNKCLSELAKRNLVARVQGAKYDGYRLTYGGYDFLAMRTFAKRGSIHSVGNQIGTGKESDIYVVADEEDNQLVCKIHRLGRISFRSIKSKRDYLRKGQSASWMYMSRLSAQKEYAFMKVLYENGFPVPKPIDQSRHCVVMELIDAFPLRQVSEVGNLGALYSALMDLIVRLANAGLIHGDFNEFNILLRESEDEDQLPEPVLIDFPQMVSTEHPDAEFYFNRDVDCIRRYFRRRFQYESAVYPHFSTVIKNGVRDFNLDVQVAASGWKKADDDLLHRFITETRQEREAAGEGDEDASEHDSDPEEEDESEHGSDPEEEDDASEEDVPELANLQLASDAEDESEDEDGETEDQPARPRKPKSTRSAAKPAVQNRDAKTVEALVATTINRNTSTNERRHHSRKAASQRILGRSKGSKRKADSHRAIKDADTSGW